MYLSVVTVRIFYLPSISIQACLKVIYHTSELGKRPFSSRWGSVLYNARPLRRRTERAATVARMESPGRRSAHRSMTGRSSITTFSYRRLGRVQRPAAYPSVRADERAAAEPASPQRRPRSRVHVNGARRICASGRRNDIRDRSDNCVRHRTRTVASGGECITQRAAAKR